MKEEQKKIVLFLSCICLALIFSMFVPLQNAQAAGAVLSLSDCTGKVKLPSEASIRLNKSAITFYLESAGVKKQQLSAKITGESSRVKWKSSNPAVASVDQTGNVSAKKKGKATITAEANGKKASCRVTVKNASIKLNKVKITLYSSGKDSSAQLKATVNNGRSKNSVTWKSSNLKAVKVKKTGKVIAVGEGTAMVTAKCGKLLARCKIVVKKRPYISSANGEYKKLIKRYETKYGKAKLYASRYLHYWTGVCFAKLLDFNNDGTKELILAYQNGSGKTDNIKYHVELWTYAGKKAKKICSSVSWTGNNSEYFGYFSIKKYNGKYLLFLSAGAAGNDVYYGEKKDKTIGAVHTFYWKGDAIEGQWYHNGVPISTKEYVNYYKKFNHNIFEYKFSSADSDEQIRKELSQTQKTLNN